MTNAHNIDLSAVLADRLATGPSRRAARAAVHVHPRLMGAEADARCVGPATASAASAPTNAMATGGASSDPPQGTFELAIPNCGRARISRTGCWNAANVPGER